MSGIVYNKSMLFKIGNTIIPDPGEYDYSSQSLDTSAERDTTGLLHRKMVATKFNVALQWSGIDYVTAHEILKLIRPQEFIFSFPCPEEDITVSNPNGLHTGKYYCGDRKVSVLVANKPDKSKWICSLQFDLIEY